MTTPALLHATPPEAIGEWRGLLDKLLPGAEINQLLSDPSDPQLRRELYRFVMESLVQAYQLRLAMHKDFPLWIDMLNFPLATVGANPDTVYKTTVFDDRGVYRLWGKRGKSRQFAVQISAAITGGPIEGVAKELHTFNVDDLTLGANGEFEVMLSAQQPAEWSGDWWPLKPGAGFGMVRMVSYDWENEAGGTIHIERLNPSTARPMRLSADELLVELNGAVKFAVGSARVWVDYVARMRRNNVVNRFEMNSFGAVGGWGRQVYWQGFHDIGADEALVIEIEVPHVCPYWNLQITDEFWRPMDYFNSISSLNGFQARPAANGKVYAVIAERDPGVPNWLDTGGYNRGAMLGRWNGADAAPTPTIVRTSLRELRRHLPADTPDVTPTRRAEQIAALRREQNQRFGY